MQTDQLMADLARAQAASRVWDQAAEALRIFDFASFDKLMVRFRELNTRENGK